MISGIGKAYAGIAEQLQRFDRSAARVASAPDPSVDYVAEVVEQQSAEHALKASVATIKTGDEMLGALIDIFA